MKVRTILIFSGFEPNDIGHKKQSDTVTSASTSNVASCSNSKSSFVVKQKGKTQASKKSKGKAPSEKSKKKKSTGMDIENLTEEEILQLKDLLGFNTRDDDGPSVFDMYGNRPENLVIECENDGACSDTEFVQSSRPPLKSLDTQISGALFDTESLKENELSDDLTWQLPKLKTPQKGEAVSPYLASLINTACTSQCDTDEIIGRYKLPSNCEKLSAPLVNADVWSEIGKKAQTYKAFQALISIGIMPIIKLASVLKSQISNNSEAKSMISDALTLLGEAQYNLSVRRRLRPFLKKWWSWLQSVPAI